jgi:hypothetical protein
MADRPQTLRPGPERDEAATYRPVAGLAIAAILLAGVTAATLLGVWITARARGRPVLVSWLLVVAAIGLVLSAVARWQVIRAQGTRTGMGLARAALWLSLLSLGSYGAYYLAIDWAVHKQARAIADQFYDHLSKGEPEFAFRLSRPPGQQRDIPKDDREYVRKRFGANEYHQFQQSDIIRHFLSWQDKTRLEYVGPGKWDDIANGFSVELHYNLRTPEGLYDIVTVTLGLDDPGTGAREWYVMPPPTTRILPENEQLTHLGRMTRELELLCGRRFMPEWQKSLPAAKPADVAAVVRVEGHAPPEANRDKLIEEVKRFGAITLFPGSSAIRTPGLPVPFIDGAGARLVHTLQVDAPEVKPECPGVLTIQIFGNKLVADMQRLSGPDWEKEPLEIIEDDRSQLLPYTYEFQVTELNLRPSLPSIAAAPSPTGNRPRGGSG